MLSFFSRKPLSSSILGKKGEQLAARHLRSKGYKILGQNYTNSKGKRLGEIDIIAFKEGFLVFVEVKTRFSLDAENCFPEENIHPSKLYKLSRIAEQFLKSRRLDYPYRFDAISITIHPETQEMSLRHLEHIFL
ncbi:MAG TPA: YraN family protein [Candidatus Moranbacteria bacterium]|nr:YraN family protein [Candidatus Moranbacteria bacterium]